MARKRSSRVRRDGRTITNRRLPNTQFYQFDLEDFLPRSSPPVNLDRRTFYPDDFRPAVHRSGRPHTLTISSHVVRAPIDHFPSPHVAFDAPKSVMVCVRRKQRKEVLHATRKAGKRGQKAPRRSVFSDIHC